MRAVQTKAPAVRQIAVKLMDDDSRPGEFPPEVTIMAKLSNVRSKHIVRVYKYARRARLQDEDGYSYIGMYMEYFPGGVLGISMNGDPDPYLILVYINFSATTSFPHGLSRVCRLLNLLSNLWPSLVRFGELLLTITFCVWRWTYGVYSTV